MSCGIYKWTSPSGKSYIGQSVNLEKRKQDFITNQLYTTRKERGLTVIDKARKKYPDFEQWTYEILEFCNPNELNDKEQYYINLFDTFNNGYNETIGGGQNIELSVEIRKRISESLKGEKHPMYGKHLKEETKEKLHKVLLGKKRTPEQIENIRQSQLGKIRSDKSRKKQSETIKGKNNPMYGKHHKDESIEKMRQSKLGENNPRYGKTPWNKGKTMQEETRKKISNAQSKQVFQFSIDGTLIKSWSSAQEIKMTLGYASSNICNCCNGKLKSAYGFIWRYHN